MPKRHYFAVNMKRFLVDGHHRHRLFVGMFMVRDYPESEGPAARQDLKLLTMEVHKVVESVLKTVRQRTKKKAARARNQIVWPGPLKTEFESKLKSLKKVPKEIHVLYHGRTLCHFSQKVYDRTGKWLPRDWPPGHVFISISEDNVIERANCSVCKARYTLIKRYGVDSILKEAV